LTLYFTAGIPGPGGAVEDHGLFGSISVASAIPLQVVDVTSGTITLSWSGGTSPYLIQRKISLTDSNWFNVLTTTNQTAVVAKDAGSALYRLKDHATNNVTPFTVFMTAAAEGPNVQANGTGFGILSLEGNIISYQISFAGLTGPAQAAHIHAIADTTQSASPITPLNAPAATAGMLAGTADVSSYTPDQMAALKTGKTYVNIHTAANPGGELRGQVAPVFYAATMSGPAEVPPVNSSGIGSGQLTLVGNELFWNVTYSGLTSGANAAHIHAPASATQTAAPIIPLGDPTGTSGSLTGRQVLILDWLDDLLDGATYMNVHTANNPGGEIRGQIMPQ
jgi:hypothetical protein